MTYMKAWVSYKFSQVLLLVYPILYILAGNDDMHETWEKFEIQPDSTTDWGVSCLWASEEKTHRLTMEKWCCYFFLAALDRIHLYLQVTMTYMRAWMSLKFGQIWLLVSMATDRVIMKKTVWPLFSAVFYPILFILAGNDDMHESSEELKIRPGLTTDCGVRCPWASEKIPIDL